MLVIIGLLPSAFALNRDMTDTQIGEIAKELPIAALVWLSVLLGLGSLDPMTRIEYQVQDASRW